MTLRLHLIRHGETAWTLTGQHTGRTDIPLTPQGEDEARALGEHLRDIPFVRVLTSPLQRARQTCTLVGLTPLEESEPDLVEWNYGDYEGKTGEDIRRVRPDWNIFHDGAPHGETPAQVVARADRLIARLRVMAGDIALFTHGHFGRVLAARWIGLSVGQAQSLLLNTASHGILSFEHEHSDQPAIEQWNVPAPTEPVSAADTATRATLKRRALDRWENEGGEIPGVPAQQPGAMPPGECSQKKLLVFDLDGTLARSKASLDAEMSALLGHLLGRVKVAVISGGDWSQFQAQLLAKLPVDANLGHLSILPTCGTKFYHYVSGWQQLYADNFTGQEKAKIVRSLQEVAGAEEFAPKKTWGEQIEDRGSQITFSGLGQRAPLDQKEQWDPDFAKRKQIKARLEKLMPEFTVRLGGTTSIDVTKLGIDKAHGIKKLREILGLELDEMLFAGDAVFPGGNDYPVKAAGVVSIQVKNPEETKRVIETFLACSGEPLQPR